MADDEVSQNNPDTGTPRRADKSAVCAINRHLRVSGVEGGQEQLCTKNKSSERPLVCQQTLSNIMSARYWLICTHRRPWSREVMDFSISRNMLVQGTARLNRKRSFTIRW